jgi:hypothetical protein
LQQSQEIQFLALVQDMRGTTLQQFYHTGRERSRLRQTQVQQLGSSQRLWAVVGHRAY